MATRFPRWNCSYRAFKSRRNTDIEGEDQRVRSSQHLILQLLLVVAAFIWQTRIGCYGNGLIDVEEKPKILPKVFDNTGPVLSETAVTCGNLLSIRLKILCIFSKSSLDTSKSSWTVNNIFCMIFSVILIFFVCYVYSHKNHNNQIETAICLRADLKLEVFEDVILPQGRHNFEILLLWASSAIWAPWGRHQSNMADIIESALRIKIPDALFSEIVHKNRNMLNRKHKPWI